MELFVGGGGIGGGFLGMGLTAFGLVFLTEGLAL